MEAPESFWTAVATGGLAVIQAVLVALIALKRRAPPGGSDGEVVVPVRPSPEFSDAVGRMERSVTELVRGGGELAGQVKTMQETLQVHGKVVERVAVVEDGLKRTERLHADTNNEVHDIKHSLRNISLKVDAMGALVLGTRGRWQEFVKTGQVRDDED